MSTRIEVAAPVAMSGDEFLLAAQQELGIWGGMSSTVGRDDDLEQRISFDPRTATDGLEGIIRWLNAMDIEYTLTIHHWMEEPTIPATALLDFLALIDDDMGSVIYGPQHAAGRHEALNQVRVYVTALIEPEVAA